MNESWRMLEILIRPAFCRMLPALTSILAGAS